MSNPIVVRPRRRAPKRKVAKRARKAPKRRSSMVRMIKKVVQGQAEKKFIRYQFANSFGAYNTATWSANALLPLTPYTGYTDIAQGTGQSNRVGNLVRTHKLIFNGYIQPKPYSLGTNPSPMPQEVMMIIFSTREDSTTLQTSLPQFINNGNSSIAPQGTLIDTIQPLNTDMYTIYYKRLFKVGYEDYAGTGSSPDSQYHGSNDFKLINRFYVDCTKWCPKNLKFNDTDNTPSNRILYVAFLPMNYNGTSQVSGLVTTQVNACWQYVFTDI